MSQEKIDLPYNSYNNLMKKLFECRVYKVSIDGGFSCPNRDGTKSDKGCIFCDEMGSSSRTNDRRSSITEQVQSNIKIRKARYKAKKFIAYLQSFSNTYGSLLELKNKYDEAINADKDIVGLSISTRPDCIDEEKLGLIASYKEKLQYVCVEYGMQTRHDKTLNIINRKESHEDFLKALELTKKYRLRHCAHVILGLPGESIEDQMETAKTLARLNVDGIKIHLLVAMQNTLLASMYNKGLWKPLSYSEYISLACSFLERIPFKAVVHRISSVSGHPLHIIAPEWMKQKNINISSDIIGEFRRRNTHQGYFC